MMNLRILIIGLLVVGVSWGASTALTQEAHKHGSKEQAEMKMEGHDHPAEVPKKGPVYISSDELHASGGVPKGWSFTIPRGNPEAGRRLFVDLECFKCHTLAGADFPHIERGTGDVGPDLTSMGEHHPAEYFAESIINPNAVIVIGQGYTGADGLSVMPNYNDILTLQQLIDLVAYLKSLRGDGQVELSEGHAQHPEGHFPYQPGEHKHQAEEHKHHQAGEHKHQTGEHKH